MSRPTAHPDTLALANRAAALDARGAFAEAAGVWALAAEREPAFLPAQLGLAQARIRAGQPAEALAVLARVGERAPGVPAVWLASGVAHSMLGRHDLAVESAARAVSLAPNVAAVHLGLGDILRQAGRLEPATTEYRRAAALSPDDPDALSKLSVVERASGHLAEAEALLRRALARAPAHPYARVNLGTLLLERRDDAEGRALLASALSSPGLPGDARQEAADAVAMLDERAALAPAIAESTASGDPAALEAALRARPAPSRRDDGLLALIDRAAARIADEPPVDALFATGSPRSAAWPALEAHHNFLIGGSDDAIARSVRLVAGRIAAQDDRDADVVRYAGAVASRRPSRGDAGDPVAREAQLRLTHVRLVGHRNGLAPGQFKVVNNMVHGQPQVPRTPPGSVAGTLRAWFGEHEARVPPGPWRAAFVMMVMSEIHPFFDGNGRVQRYLANAELAAAGCFPSLRAGNSHADLPPILNEARRTGIVRPVLEWIAAGSRYARDLDRRWADSERL